MKRRTVLPPKAPSGSYGDLAEDFERALRRDEMRSGCPPGLRNFLIACVNLAVLGFIVIVVSKIFYDGTGEEQTSTLEHCQAEDSTCSKVYHAVQ